MLLAGVAIVTGLLHWRPAVARMAALLGLKKPENQLPPALEACLRKIREPRFVLGFYALALLAGMFASYSLLWHRSRWPEAAGSYPGLLLPSCAEVVVFWGIGRLLLGPGGLRGHPWHATAFLANALVFSMLMPVQCYALLYSNSFISVLALENIAEARLVASASQPVLVAAAIIAAFALTWLCRGGGVATRAPAAPRVRSYAVAAVAVVAAATALASNRAAPVADGAGGLNPGQSPVAAMLLVGWQEWRLHHQDAMNATPVKDDAPYPYLKDWINRDPLPFPGHPPARRPNVLVFFVEGMSARVLGAYGGSYPGLTPNLDALAHETMVVDNYYNHTAATYRGLQGQMTSGYPRYGGSEGGEGWLEGDNADGYAKRSYSSLSGILHAAGYHTVFFTPHPAKVALNRLVGMLGFDERFDRERSVETLLRDDPVQPFIAAALTDHDLFLALRRYMEKFDGERPLFLGWYNIGTHAFMDVDPNGVRYGDGSNHSLNTIHNLDVQFGEFYRWFARSRYARDTVLVFTSDHAHYPEPSYVEIAGKGGSASGPYDPYFVDRIPMFVRAPWLRLPGRFDARDRTSLDLAPTVLSLVGIDRAPNSFLGQSIFRPFSGHDPDPGLAALGPSMYAIYRGRVYASGQEPPAAAARYEHEVGRASRYHALEAAGRIFPSRQVVEALGPGPDLPAGANAPSRSRPAP